VSLALPSSAIAAVVSDFTTSKDIVLRVKLHGSSSSALNNKRLTGFEHFGENVAEIVISGICVKERG
jgi:poly(3-hydroxybutyrate) depolymerase